MKTTTNEPLPSYQVQVSDAIVCIGDTVFCPDRTKGRVEYIKEGWVGVRSENGHTPTSHNAGRVDEWQASQLVFRPWRVR